MRAWVVAHHVLEHVRSTSPTVSAKVAGFVSQVVFALATHLPPSLFGVYSELNSSTSSASVETL